MELPALLAGILFLFSENRYVYWPISYSAGIRLGPGGWLAIAPSRAAASCGNLYYRPNYGLVFTAYGAGAIIGNLLTGSE